MTRLPSKENLRSLLVILVAPLVAFGQSRHVEDMDYLVRKRLPCAFSA